VFILPPPPPPPPPFSFYLYLAYLVPLSRPVPVRAGGRERLKIKIKRTEALAACVYTEQTTFPPILKGFGKEAFYFFSNKPGACEALRKG
jgi:hypothetical protein